MRRRSITALSLFLTVLFSTVLTAAVARAVAPVPLESFPVCEASAALAVPCSADPSATCVWIADDEQSEAIFQYRVDADGRLLPGEPFRIPLEGAKVGDIESLASDSSGVLAVGSHSRTRSCKADPGRVAVARLSGDPLRAELVASASGYDDRARACESKWLVLGSDEPEAARSLQRDFCAAVAAGERTATPGDTDSCAGATLEIEGAVQLPDAAGGRLWLGLRAPLVQGLAVLLRVAPLRPGKRLAFDGIATIDLRGGGVRELALSEGWLWGIAGATTDDGGPHRLWRVPVDRLRSGTIIGGVETVAELPPGAEGLVVQAAEKRAIVVIDGATGKQDGRCKVAARQLTIPLSQ